MNKQEQDLDTGNWYWTDEYVESLEEAARAMVESKYVADSTDCGVIWSVGELEFDALAALIKEKNE